MSTIESDVEYFRRRHQERKVLEEAKSLEARESQERWQTRLDGLVDQYDSDVKRLLMAFAGEAPEVASYHIYGPEEKGHQLTWWIEYTKGKDLAKRTILVVLHYLQGLDGTGQFVPDYFSLEGLIALNTIKPPTIEALRKALGDATFRP